MTTTQTIRRVRELHAQGCTPKEIHQVTHLDPRIIAGILTASESSASATFPKPQPPEFLEPLIP